MDEMFHRQSELIFLKEETHFTKIKPKNENRSKLVFPFQFGFGRCRCAGVPGTLCPHNKTLITTTTPSAPSAARPSTISPHKSSLGHGGSYRTHRRTVHPPMQVRQLESANKVNWGPYSYIRLALSSNCPGGDFMRGSKVH